MIRTLLDWSITSSALILLVLALRALVGQRVSPRLRYGLWLLVMVRLATPNLPWDSGTSVLGALRENPGYQLAATLPERLELYEDGRVKSMAGGEEHFNWDGLGTETFHNAYGWTAVPTEEEARSLRESGGKAVDTAQLKRLVDAQSILEKVWLGGAWLVGGFFLAVNLYFYRNLRKTRRRDGDYRGRPVYEADGLPSPCLFGLFSPAIYLTPGLEGDARDHVLAHEYAHFRQGDQGWAVWRGVLLALHWYNPLVWLAAVLSRRDCELSCDEGAVRLLGEEHRADYGRTLVGLVARKTVPTDLLRCATTMTGGKSAVKERIALLVKRPRTTAAMACAVGLACLGIALCTFTGAAASEEMEPEDPPVQAEREDAAQPPAESADPVRLEIPENLPTDLMDLSRPPEEQGEWLLLAQAPYTDAALYRRADDDQHVYLRLTNQSFQQFDRDLSGMELLPTMDLWDGGVELALEVLYRRYEGTYFNGVSNEPGIVAEQVIYNWSEAEKSWEELHIRPSTVMLTRDLPALADLPRRLVTPGSPEAEADMWLIGELSPEDIAVYYEQSTDKIWLRYGESIQAVEGMAVCMPQMLLPALYFEDLDGDGDRELIAISQAAAGSGVAQELLSVYAWDGQSWTWNTHHPENLAESFNTQRVYQFYEDGRAYVSCWDQALLLDLSSLWELGYWDSRPDHCFLSELQTNYRYEDGLLTLTLGGGILDTGGHFLHGWCFQYDCPVIYSGGYLRTWDGVLGSGYALEPEAPVLTENWRSILRRTAADCDPAYPNAWALQDVDGDGAAELIVRWKPAGSVASAWGTSVYDGFGAERFHGHGTLTFYSNGAVEVPWSHNQGQACAIWPYTLYQYSPLLGYLERGSVRAISSQMDTFPSAADADGDGLVYYIGEDALTEEHVVDGGAYQAWRGQYLAGAEVLPVVYFPLAG